MVRGDVHEIVLPRRRGRVQHGPRYALIVQADDLLALSTIVICPTSQSTPPASFHPEVSFDNAATRGMVHAVEFLVVTEPVEEATSAPAKATRKRSASHEETEG